MATEKRLIDANFLEDRCRQQISDDWNKRVAPCSWSEAYKEFLDDVWDAPIVDAVEVKHGWWIEKEYVDEPYGGYYLFHCSECGIPNARERNYCPNCGAKMDGDGNG